MIKGLFKDQDLSDELLDAMENIIFERANNNFKSKEYKSATNEMAAKIKGPRNNWIRENLISNNISVEDLFKSSKEIEEI